MARKSTALVAEICLYGNHNVGYGWLANREGSDRILGDGEPKEGRSATEAIWLACEAIRQAGIDKGAVRVFAPNGVRMADTDLNHPGYFGTLKWTAAPVLEISAEAIEAAASK